MVNETKSNTGECIVKTPGKVSFSPHFEGKSSIRIGQSKLDLGGGGAT